MMNLRRRGVRYGFPLNFAIGFAGAAIVAAAVATRFNVDLEIPLAAALVVALMMHARLGFALGRKQEEVEVLQKLYERTERPAPLPNADLIEPEPSAASAEDFEALARVREAIVAERIDLYLQPIVSLPQRKLRFFEAFSRLRDPAGRILRPAEYLEAAERANRIGVIDNMILMRCIQALRRRHQEHPRLVVFCNLSPATLFDVQFFNDLTDYLEANADLAASLVFEFTYPAIHMMHPRAEDNLAAIARKGFAFSVDHVHSLDLDWEALRAKNFRYAKAPARMLLGASLGGGQSAARLRQFRKRMSDAGVDLIAEKIELENQMPNILSLGLDYGQGNLFGPARSAEFYLTDARAPASPAPETALLALAS